MKCICVYKIVLLDERQCFKKTMQTTLEFIGIGKGIYWFLFYILKESYFESFNVPGVV